MIRVKEGDLLYRKPNYRGGWWKDFCKKLNLPTDTPAIALSCSNSGLIKARIGSCTFFSERHCFDLVKVDIGSLEDLI